MTYADAIQESSNAHPAVTSGDGTRIEYRTVGSGPAVILVPGALALARDFDGLARALATRFTVHAIERRGRGGSSDNRGGYSIQRECEDVAAVQEATGATLLFGHSFGGLVALEAARMMQTFTKVAVYEPGISIDGSVPTDWVERCRLQLAAEHGFDAFVTFVRGVNPRKTGRVPRPLLKLILQLAMRNQERQQKYQLLPTAIREHLEAARLDNTHHRYSSIAADVLLMAGKKEPTAAGIERTLARLQLVLPQAQLITFPRLDHFGPEKKPDEVTATLSEFFDDRDTKTSARPPQPATEAEVEVADR
jgi:pimeloyl-ACP methyl ester carboxylesterase